MRTEEEIREEIEKLEIGREPLDMTYLVSFDEATRDIISALKWVVED